MGRLRVLLCAGMFAVCFVSVVHAESAYDQLSGMTNTGTFDGSSGESSTIDTSVSPYSSVPDVGPSGPVYEYPSSDSGYSSDSSSSSSSDSYSDYSSDDSSSSDYSSSDSD